MSDTVLTANDGSAESLLHEAAWRGDLEEVTRLVDGGADVNWRDSIGETALFGAAAWGHVEVVRHLVDFLLTSAPPQRMVVAPTSEA
jgi:ankyrin repeat protein